jgi:hypothetical protein
MISIHQNSVHFRDSAATTKGQTALSSTNSRYNLDHRESDKEDKESQDPIRAKNTSLVSCLFNSFENEPLPRRHAYACSSVNEVARAFEMNVPEGKLTNKTPHRCRVYAICSVNDFREAFELGPDQG